MKNKKGFTLVELLAVITLLGLLVVIAVPSGLAISKKVKQKMLDSKIELIESGAIVWGQQNKNSIPNKSTASPSNCSSAIASNSNVTKCIRKTIRQLVHDENALEEDGINSSGYRYLKNPTNDKELHTCYIYIYVKNKRVYATYDKTFSPSTCYYTND